MAAPAAAILGCAGPVLTGAERRFFADANPIGFILFARNVETPDQLHRLTGDLRAALGRDAPILVDQEGGRVQRMTPPHWRAWPPPLTEAEAPHAERRAYLRARIIAAELLDVGIDTNCVPCLDIATADTHPFLRNRCWGEDADTVTRLGRAVAQGFLDGGVAPVIKHMPGHGRSTLDTHFELPRVTAPLDTLIATDFAPFRAMSELPYGMTGHVRIEALDPDAPATHSKTVLDYIRAEIGFDGLLMTDDISMEALDGDVAERSQRAIAAGCDAVLHCNGKLGEMQSVVAVSGALSESGCARLARAVAGKLGNRAGDLAAYVEEYQALSGK